VGAGGELMAALRISYRHGVADDVVKLGAFAQIAAKRRFGMPAMKDDDPEPLLFGVFVELHGPAVAKDGDAFDEWLVGVDSFELVTEDPPVAEVPATTETPSDPLPDSPPISD